MTRKEILDVTCGSRQIWFQKNEPHTVYCDIRKETLEIKTENGGVKRLDINPDIVCDFTALPFNDNQFSLVIFDPPHIENLCQSSMLRKEYGSLDGSWQPMIRQGFSECMRVLKNTGVLIFKWSEVKIPTREIINIIGQEPLFGHKSGKKMNTNWLCFMKFEKSAYPIVRCKDCKLFDAEHEGSIGSCGIDMNVTANDYCSKAERKDEVEE
jgi:SAM-dependent methyltransferase